MTTAPLLELFLELRRRNLLLGVSEFLAGLEALARGFGTGSRKELTWMCQALWAKSQDDQDEIAEAVAVVLPRELTPTELEDLARQAEKALTQAEEGTTDATARRETSPPEVAQKPAEQVPAPGRVELAPVATTPAAQAPYLSRAADELRQKMGTSFDLLGDLPVPRRYIKRAWRYVRRMQRVGPAVELDVEGTAARRYRDGVLTAPVLMPRRRNLASVLLLIDEGGSMVPFRQMTRAVAEGSRHSGFARADVLYFHDVVGEVVFRDASLRTPVSLADTLRPFTDSGVMILSDAGAARRRLDLDRVVQTRRFLATIRRVTPRVAWLNPVPRERWAQTTAEKIVRGGVSMYPFDRAGLDATMDVLRGRTL